MLCNMFFSYLLKHFLCLKFHTLYILSETKSLNIKQLKIVCSIMLERTIIWILMNLTKIE